MDKHNDMYDLWQCMAVTHDVKLKPKKEKKPFDAKVFVLSCVVGFLIWFWFIGQY